MEKKICLGCKRELELSEFHMHKGKHRSRCKKCRLIEKQEYIARPEIKEKLKKYYQDNKQSMRARLSEYYWTLVSQYHGYIKSAKKREIEFPLSKEQCEDFYNKTCYYCNMDYKGLGIDRVDNNSGYLYENCVPCCKICNWMKRAMSKDDFYEHIEKILNNKK